MSNYDYALGIISLMVVIAAIFLIITHIIGARFDKAGRYSEATKVNEAFMIGFATFCTISMLLGVYGFYYFWRICYGAAG